MTQFELAQLAKKISGLYIQPWHEREPKLIKSKDFKYEPYSIRNDRYDQYYSYVINDWIPTQKDSESLMNLFIWVDFQLMPFFTLIVSPPPGRKTDKKAS